MRERKYVKFRVDMYEDTKFKIIDMKSERDTIHYIWTRLVGLAGKVNLDGELYLSRNIPYTLETLAIEFNRDVTTIKLAFDVFGELEMIEFTEEKVYRVKNFVRHQNIKVKEKNKYKNKEENIDKTDNTINENLLDEMNENTDKEAENVEDKDNEKLEIVRNDITNMADKTKDERKNNNSQNHVITIIETKKDRQANKKNNVEEIDVIDEDIENDLLCCFTDGVRTLEDGENTVFELSFG